MSWGYRIVIVYSVFVAGILFMVFRSSNEKFDLVTDDYYGKELQFQQQIDAVKRTAALSGTVKCVVTNNSLQVNFPKDFEGKKIEGELRLYYAADKTKDVVKQFTATGNTAVLALPQNNKGSHRLFVIWKVSGTAYYYEEIIFL
jgi:hypothetical protein